jgi:hypothetical protein
MAAVRAAGGAMAGGVAEVLGLVITLIIINLHGVRTEEAVTGGGVEGRDLVLIVINKVIKGFGIIGELEVVEVRAEADRFPILAADAHHSRRDRPSLG